MVGLRWLRLNSTGIDTVPYELSNLKKLVSVSSRMEMIYSFLLLFHIVMTNCIMLYKEYKVMLLFVLCVVSENRIKKKFLWFLVFQENLTLYGSWLCLQNVKCGSSKCQKMWLILPCQLSIDSWQGKMSQIFYILRRGPPGMIITQMNESLVHLNIKFKLNVRFAPSGWKCRMHNCTFCRFEFKYIFI